MIKRLVAYIGWSGLDHVQRIGFPKSALTTKIPFAKLIWDSYALRMFKTFDSPILSIVFHVQSTSYSLYHLSFL